MYRYFLPVVAALCLLLTFSCDSGPAPLEDILRGDMKTAVNPYGRVPLGALLTFKTKEPCRVAVTVMGEEPLRREFATTARLHELPVLGLYPDKMNEVELELTAEDGSTYVGKLNLQTKPLPSTFPDIKVTALKKEAMEPGFHLIDMLLANNGKFLPYTIMFDDNGTIRWFMDLSENGQITYTPHRLANGNWLYLNWINLLEVTDLGRTVSEQQMWGNAGNHEIIEMPDGKLLMTGSRKDSYVVRKGEKVGTRFDHVVLWDREQGRTARDWDMRSVLDVSRAVFPADYGMDPATDWFHVNSVAVDPEDNALLVSGRNQGVVKIGQKDNDLRWILAPHLGWGTAGLDGSGLNTADYLLTAVDETGKAYPQAVQEGRESAPDFDWPMGQHALNLLDNGNLLLFDNGLRRHFEAGQQYSKAVEYKIDERKKTITQVWEYGKERGLELSSPITSDVDRLPQTGNRLITSGNVRAGEKPGHAKLVEVTYPDNEVVFEAELYFKDALGTKEKSWGQFDLVFRGERYPLLPKK